MPLLRKASDGASAPRARSPAKGGAPSSPAARPASSKGGGGGKPGGGEAGRKAPTPVPAPAGQGGDDYAVPIREVVRPPNQLQLSAAELEEEVGRSLTAGNPAAPTSLVRYSYKDRAFRPEPIIDQQLQHLALGGSLMHRDSDEAARERHRRESNALLAHSRRVTAASRRVTAAHGGDAGSSGPVRASEVGGALRAAASVAAAAVEGEGGPRLHNQFNCADRGVQTGHRRPRNRSTMTEPPPTTTASGSCSRWEIYEAYVADQDRQRQTEELARQKAQAARREARAAQQTAAVGQQAGRVAPLPGDEEQDGGASLAPLSGQAAKLMERMVQQNLHCDMVMDFKYWDDPADDIKQDEGTLLPLWSFTNPRAKSRAVTAIVWSPRYFDMFAVGYGSFDFLKPTTGLVAVYSLKNPGHPEFSFSTAAGVMCLDFHPEHPALLAVGCYDGHIAIFDVRMGGGEPLYRSTPRSGKHSDPVWQVAWQRTVGHELQLASISTDGRVTLWTVSRNELIHQDLMELRSLRGRNEGPSGSTAEPADGPRPATGAISGSSSGREATQAAGGETGVGIAGGCSFDFNREQETLFVVGSEDGSLYKCSTAYASEYLQAYRPGHQLPVYAVRWNGLHSRTFLSAGADWKVKLWDSVQPKPVLSFDLQAPVGDVAWAPQSSTVFAAATDSGHVHVFEVAHSRAAAVCVQRVAKMRLTKLAFNGRHPVLLVGTERGGVLCLKLSPNLRRSFNPGACSDASDSRAVARTESQRVAARAAEAARLEAVLVAAAKCNAALRDEDMALL